MAQSFFLSTLHGSFSKQGFAFLGCLLLGSCGPVALDTPTMPQAVQLPATFRSLSPQDAHAELCADSGLVLLDARHWDEMKDAPHLAGAIPCPYLQGNEAALESLDRAGSYLIYCPLGERSARTAVKMHEMGFQKVAVLSGGLHAWLQAKLPLDPRK